MARMTEVLQRQARLTRCVDRQADLAAKLRTAGDQALAPSADELLLLFQRVVNTHLRSLMVVAEATFVTRQLRCPTGNDPTLEDVDLAAPGQPAGPG